MIRLFVDFGKNTACGAYSRVCCLFCLLFSLRLRSARRSSSGWLPSCKRQKKRYSNPYVDVGNLMLAISGSWWQLGRGNFKSYTRTRTYVAVVSIRWKQFQMFLYEEGLHVYTIFQFENDKTELGKYRQVPPRDCSWTNSK